MSSVSLVFDFGSHTIKAGRNTSDKPDFIIPSAFPAGDHAHPIDKEIPADAELDDAIAEGEVNNTDRLSFILATLYDHYFPDEKNEPEELKIVMTETPYSSLKHIEYLGEMAFGLLGATDISIKPQGVFAQTPFALPSAICLDVGHEITSCVPICKEYVIPQAIRRSFMAGSALDLFTSRCILELDDFSTFAESEKVRIAKETQVKISDICLSEKFKTVDPDDIDTVMQYTCGETLFNTKLMETAALDPKEPENDPEVCVLMEAENIAEIVASSIRACDLPCQADLWANIIVTGGTTKLPGFRERLQNELNTRKPEALSLQLRFPEDPVLATWKGAALSATYDTPQHWLTREEYEEDSNAIFEKFRTFGTSFKPGE